jgi:hypothetical protein
VNSSLIGGFGLKVSNVPSLSPAVGQTRRGARVALRASTLRM